MVCVCLLGGRKLRNGGMSSGVTMSRRAAAAEMEPGGCREPCWAGQPPCRLGLAHQTGRTVSPEDSRSLAAHVERQPSQGVEPDSRAVGGVGRSPVLDGEAGQPAKRQTHEGEVRDGSG